MARSSVACHFLEEPKVQRAGSVLLNNFKSAFGGACKFLAGSGQVLFCGVSPRGNQRLRSL